MPTPAGPLLFLLLFVGTVNATSEYTLCPHLSRWNEATKKCTCPNETVLYNEHCVSCGNNTQWSVAGCQCYAHHEKITDITCAPIDCSRGAYNETSEECECRKNYRHDHYGKCTIEPCGEQQVWDVPSQSCVCMENHVPMRRIENYEWVERCEKCGAFTQRSPQGSRFCKCLPYYASTFEPACRVPACENGSFDPSRGCACNDGFIPDERDYGRCKKYDKAAEDLSAEAAGLRIIESGNGTRICLWDGYANGEIKVALFDCFSFPYGRDRLWIIENRFGTVVFKKRRIRGKPNLYLTSYTDGSVGATEHEQHWTPFKNDDGTWRFQTIWRKWLSWDGNQTLRTTDNSSSALNFTLESWTDADLWCPSLARFDAAAGKCVCLPNYVFVEHVTHTDRTTYTEFCVPCGATTKWTPDGCECLPQYTIRVDAFTCKAHFSGFHSKAHDKRPRMPVPIRPRTTSPRPDTTAASPAPTASYPYGPAATAFPVDSARPHILQSLEVEGPATASPLPVTTAAP